MLWLLGVVLIGWVWCRFEYLWQDSGKFRKPTKMPAPEYIEHLMAWVQDYINNEAVFPSRIGTVAPLTTSPPLSPPRYVTNLNRRPLPQELPNHRAPARQAPIPCLCAHLLPPLPGHCGAGARPPYEHELQALCALHQGV